VSVGSEHTVDDGSGMESSESTDEGLLFDVGPPPCGGGQNFSYIWIANAAQGTLSKIDTRTVTEVARYQTRPDLLGDPSRTSVDLNGDAAVANRSGGITKFWARDVDCEEQNGSAGIQTSTGKSEVLDWDQEECRAWHTAFPLGPEGSQRPVAFTSGVLDEDSCRWVDVKLWTATYDPENSPDVNVHRLEAESGMVEADVVVSGIDVSALGAYGGAVDAEGDFWFFTDVTSSPLVEVDAETLTYSVHIAPNDVNGYGIAVDHAGRVWLSGLSGGTARFDPDTETWEVVFNALGYGIQEDGQGRMWMGRNPLGIRWIDAETLEVGPILLQNSEENIRGVSIDVDGHVWAVQQGNVAYRMDPDTLEVVSYDGLDGAYTYSDMTGWGLSNITPAG
jgi:hypothetical protein